ncbi:hypothetical protein FRC17_011261 [Serendipita sp. 399]|nr:hypothetical protein FRC17_011261 [Serendipita sp. 399]
MALYQLPKATLNSLRLNIKGGLGHQLTSVVPSIVDTFLTRLADPSPTHHLLRAPFIRPLLHTNASKQPLYNLLSPVYEPEPDHLEPDSPVQARLIEFFEEKKYSLLIDTVIEEDLPIFVYSIHRKRMLGAPQLVINESYNSSLNRASKVVATAHLISVMSHQFSLMLQAQADPEFRVTTSRKPSDLDRSSEFQAMKRASFTDFLMEKRGGTWQLAGCFQPDQATLDGSVPSSLTHKETGEKIPFYQPRAMTQHKLMSWYSQWNKSQWSPQAALNFFTPESTVPWLSIEDVTQRTVGEGENARIVKVKRKQRDTVFAPALNPWELAGGDSNVDQPRRGKSIRTEEELGVWETGEAAVQRDRRRASWIDKLSANDLDQQQNQFIASNRYTPRSTSKSVTGANNSPLGSKAKWGSPSSTRSESPERQQTSSSSEWSNATMAPRKGRNFGERYSREPAPHSGRRSQF